MKLNYFFNIRLISLGFLIGTILPIEAAFGATVTRQEFSGELNLIDVSSLLEDSVPENSEYSGFIVYDETNSLIDWQFEADNLDLSLNPDSSESNSNPFDDVELTPTVNFDLSSTNDWNLVIDFGIAFDAPRYTIARMPDSEITLTGALGLAGGYTYTDTDTNSNIVTSLDDSTPVPESSTVFGLILACGVGLSLLKRQGFAK